MCIAQIAAIGTSGTHTAVVGRDFPYCKGTVPVIVFPSAEQVLYCSIIQLRGENSSSLLMKTSALSGFFPRQFPHMLYGFILVLPNLNRFEIGYLNRLHID